MISLSRITAILGKELIQLKRDRMTLRMVIVIPLIQLLLFGYAINTNIRDIPVGLVDQSQSGLSRALVQTIRATQVVEFTEEFTDLTQAQAAIANAKIRAVLFIPNDVDNRLARHRSLGFGTPPSSDQETSRPIAQWIVDGSDTMVAAGIRSLRAMPWRSCSVSLPIARRPPLK